MSAEAPTAVVVTAARFVLVDASGADLGELETVALAGYGLEEGQTVRVDLLSPTLAEPDDDEEEDDDE